MIVVAVDEIVASVPDDYPTMLPNCSACVVVAVVVAVGYFPNCSGWYYYCLYSEY